MAEEFEQHGIAASVDGESEESVRFFTEALQLAPSEPRLYVYRAAEYIKLARFSDAIADADRAIELDPSFWKAFYRKGVALHKLREYSEAKSAFESGASINPTYPKFQSLISLCDAKIHADEGFPSKPEQSTNGTSLKHAFDVSSSDVGTTHNAVLPERTAVDAFPDKTSLVNSSSTSAIQAPVQPTFRHSYYQGAGYVSLSIFAKGRSKDDVHVDFGEQTLSVVIEYGDVTPYTLQCRLFGKIAVAQCKVTVTSTKVEIYLAKGDNTHWTQLEYSPQKVQSSTVAEPKVKYPSSSKKGPRDWDRLESEVKKEEKDEKLDGDAALNKLFRDIYSGADEDTRRAMNKSYVESNGTVLSTNWKEVGSKPVVASPPQGMESKKWET